MSALEQEIVEKFDQLDDEGRQRVLRLLNERPAKFNWHEWFADIDRLNAEMLAKNDDFTPIDAVSMLREMRNGDDER